MSPQGMVERARSILPGFQDMFEDMVARLKAERKAPGYIADLIKSVKSWLKYNEITLTRKIKISNLTTTPTIKNEPVPCRKSHSINLFRALPMPY